MKKQQAVASHYVCMGDGCGVKLTEQVKIFNDLYYCWECYDAKVRRKRLMDAEREFDEAPDETIE